MAKKPKNLRSNVMVELIEQGQKGILDTNNVLARVWRIALFRRGLDGAGWCTLMTQYQIKLNTRGSLKGKSNVKGNHTRMLAKPRLSWGGLMRGLDILGFSKVEIQFHLTRRGTTQVISMEVSPNEPLDDGDEEDED